MENGGFSLQRLFIEPFAEFLETLLTYLPKIMSFVLILAAGLLLALVLRGLLHRTFLFIKLDKLSEKLGFDEMLEKGGLRDPLSKLLASLVGWLTVIAFVIISLSALEVPAIEALLREFFLYLPNIFVATLILFTGYLLANFLGRATLIAAVNAGLEISGPLGRFVKLAVFLLAVTMALEQLNIGENAIMLAFAILFGGVVLALSISFGLGGRDLARRYLERKLSSIEENVEKDEFDHL